MNQGSQPLWLAPYCFQVVQDSIKKVVITHQIVNRYTPSVYRKTFESAVFDVNVTFTSNVFKVNLLGKVLLLMSMTLYITTVKQVVLVTKEWYFTVIEAPSTIPKQLVLLS